MSCDLSVRCFSAKVNINVLFRNKLVLKIFFYFANISEMKIGRLVNICSVENTRKGNARYIYIQKVV